MITTLNASKEYMESYFATLTKKKQTHSLKQPFKELLGAEEVFRLTQENKPFSLIKASATKFFHADSLAAGERIYRQFSDKSFFSRAIERAMKTPAQYVHPSEKLNSYDIYTEYPFDKNRKTSKDNNDQRFLQYTKFDVAAATLYAEQYSKHYVKDAKKIGSLARQYSSKSLEQTARDRRKYAGDLNHALTHIHGFRTGVTIDNDTGGLPTRFLSTNRLKQAVMGSTASRLYAGRSSRLVQSSYGPTERYKSITPEKNARDHSKFHHNDAQAMGTLLEKELESRVKKSVLSNAKYGR